jgi:enterochelin esterase-like enzyme
MLGTAVSVAFAAEPSCKSTVTGDLRIEQLVSKTYGTSIPVRIWLPSGYGNPENASKKYPVLYLLDGQNAFDQCTAFQGEKELGVDEAVTRLIAEGKIPPMIVVGIDSSGKRSYEYAPFHNPVTNPKDPEPIGKMLPAFLAQEVIPLVASRYRITNDPAHVGIGGASLGAAAALYAALERPDLFGLLLLESPDMILGNGQFLRETNSLARGPDRVSLGIGSTEVDFPDIQSYLAPFRFTRAEVEPGEVKMAQQLADNLRAAYLNHPKVKFTVQPGGKHSAEYWAMRVPEAIRFLYEDR